jgi:ribonuclease-3 family protein
VKFDQFQFIAGQTFGQLDADGRPTGRFAEADVRSLPPLVLAYIGDAFFNLYVRTRLLAFEQNRVRVLHSYGARMVSATLQAHALRQLEDELSEEEQSVVRRGRNAKSTVPKSASVGDYRASTGLEALLGYLYLRSDEARLTELVDKIFVIISGKLATPD